MKERYTRTFHEVHYSSDGDKWSRQMATFDDNAEGLKEAQTAAKDLARSTRHVRVVRVTENFHVLSSTENQTILSKQQIDDLKSRGSKALEGVLGVSVTEGFMIGFGSTGISHGPARISVHLSATAQRILHWA